MKVIFDQSFIKSLKKIGEKDIRKRIEKTIIQIENVPSLEQIHNIKKLQGFQNFYRIRIGDYRLGIESEKENTVRIIMIAHRKDIYKRFP